MVDDPIAAGLAGGWHVRDASTLSEDLMLDADAVIVGTGAGGGITAEVLANAGLRVVLIEEGPLKSSKDFQMEERRAYPDLYQESAARKTRDKAINILQGRCVGGGTTVNWTSSFATPEPTLRHWEAAHGVSECAPETMAPWFQKIEERLQIHRWPVPPNANNAALQIGAEQLGWSHDIMNRNVAGCANLGYCGMGCPLNAKQSMLVTTLPAAMTKGAILVTRARAHRLQIHRGRVRSLVCHGLDGRGVFPTGRKITVKARHYILAAGAIGSPALLMRSKAPDPHGLTGKRTFLHPVNVTIAVMPERVEATAGAPQSVFSDQFLWRDGVAGRMGYKLEVPPLHPLLSSTVLAGHGEHHAALMRQLPFMQATIALGRDGFHEQSRGGSVQLRDDGTPVLDYDLNEYVWDGMRRAYLSMAELQFAAGARWVMPLHTDCLEPYRSWRQAKAAILDLNMAPLRVRVFSAHVMGGCPLGDDPRRALVNSYGVHHHLEEVSVIDGSVFPTSIGSNPQVSIYGMSLKNATRLAQRLVT